MLRSSAGLSDASVPTQTTTIKTVWYTDGFDSHPACNASLRQEYIDVLNKHNDRNESHTISNPAECVSWRCGCGQHRLSTGAEATRRAYDAAVYTTNQRAALLQSNRLLTLYIPSGGKAPSGGSIPPRDRPSNHWRSH